MEASGIRSELAPSFEAPPVLLSHLGEHPSKLLGFKSFTSPSGTPRAQRAPSGPPAAAWQSAGPGPRPDPQEAPLTALQGLRSFPLVSCGELLQVYFYVLAALTESFHTCPGVIAYSLEPWTTPARARWPGPGLSCMTSVGCTHHTPWQQQPPGRGREHVGPIQLSRARKAQRSVKALRNEAWDKLFRNWSGDSRLIFKSTSR